MMERTKLVGVDPKSFSPFLLIAYLFFSFSKEYIQENTSLPSKCGPRLAAETGSGAEPGRDQRNSKNGANSRTAPQYTMLLQDWTRLNLSALCRRAGLKVFRALNNDLPPDDGCHSRSVVTRYGFRHVLVRPFSLSTD